MKSAPSPFACNTYAYTFSHDAAGCLDHLGKLGFSVFELMLYPGHLWPSEVDAAGRRDLRRAMEANGQSVVTLNMPNIDINLAAATPEMRSYTLDIFRETIRLAGDLGVPGIVIGPGKANPLFGAPRQRLIGYFYEAFDELLPLAASAGTALWAENMPFAFLPGIDEFVSVLDEYGSDEIGFVFDIANSHFVGEAPGPALMRCRERLKLVHLSDTGRDRFLHAPVGDGTVPFEALPSALAAVGYDGPLVLEIISGDPDRDISESMARLTALGIGRPDAPPA